METARTVRCSSSRSRVHGAYYAPGAVAVGWVMPVAVGWAMPVAVGWVMPVAVNSDYGDRVSIHTPKTHQGSKVAVGG